MVWFVQKLLSLSNLEWLVLLSIILGAGAGLALLLVDFLP
jgi:hypothetical protein